jgi:NTE family protein
VGKDLYSSSAIPPSLAPALRIPTDSPNEQLQEGMALCLSGGGYRAMLFHLGSVWRLNDAGFLVHLSRVSSVSGGSIIAGVIGLSWNNLEFNGNGVALAFVERIVRPLRQLASHTIDIAAAIPNLIVPGSACSRIAAAYRKHVFGTHTLQDLPDDSHGPRFIINATNLQSGALWRFSRPYMADYRVGLIPQPRIELSIAVAASSAAPPFLSPVVISLDESAFVSGSGLDLQYPPYTTRVYLTDGGVYDNLGLETAWKRCKTILVSDGGSHFAASPRLSGNVLGQTIRVFETDDNQVRSLRKRQVIASFQVEPGSVDHRKGAYWGIRSDIANYGLEDAAPCPIASTTKLANMATRLAKIAPVLQERLINWGYAVCDAAIRKHVDRALPRRAFPYPKSGVG